MSASKKTEEGVSTLPLVILHLPQDILFAILSKLPAKSLVRLRCVSKSLCALIADHGFGVLYRRLSLTLPSRAGILIAIKPRTPQTASSSAFYTINFPPGENGGKIQAKRVGSLDGREGLLLSSSDGLICLSKPHGEDVSVCNISTGQLISLPRIIQSHSPSSTCALLGFDSESKRYKVLRSAAFVNPGSSSSKRNYKYKHWVLTVGVDKSWREINNNYSSSHPFFPFDGLGYSFYSNTSVYIDGVIYFYNWLTTKDVDSRNNNNNNIIIIPRFSIVAFEVGSESFSEITFPDEVSSQWYPVDGSGKRHQPYSGFVLWSASFALLEVDGRRLAFVLVRDLCYMDVWILVEKSGEWEKSTVTIPLEEISGGDRSILRFSTNPAAGEIVLLWLNAADDDYFPVLVCNLKTHVWRKFDVGRVKDFPNHYPWEVTMYNFVDNVFPLDQLLCGQSVSVGVGVGVRRRFRLLNCFSCGR